MNEDRELLEFCHLLSVETVNQVLRDEYILESNKLIAEFMGYKVFYKRYPRNHGIGSPEVEVKDMIIDKAKYHKSWDWLKPVVDKISDLKYDFTTFQEEEMEIKKDEVILMPMYFHIDIAFGKVVKFIKWYNSRIS